MISIQMSIPLYEETKESFTNDILTLSMQHKIVLGHYNLYYITSI